jgi:hypothetical protein
VSDIGWRDAGGRIGNVTCAANITCSTNATVAPGVNDLCDAARDNHDGDLFGIVNASTAMYVDSDGENTGVIAALGEDVMILQSPANSAWIQIQRSNGTMGWVSKKSIDLCPR